MSCQKSTFRCNGCDHAFEQVVGEAILSAICPACGRAAKIVKWGMAQGFTFAEALTGVVVGFLIYKALTD